MQERPGVLIEVSVWSREDESEAGPRWDPRKRGLATFLASPLLALELNNRSASLPAA